MQQTGTVVVISMFTTQSVSTIQMFYKQHHCTAWSMKQLMITNNFIKTPDLVGIMRRMSYYPH